MNLLTYTRATIVLFWGASMFRRDRRSAKLAAGLVKCRAEANRGARVVALIPHELALGDGAITRPGRADLVFLPAAFVSAAGGRTGGAPLLSAHACRDTRWRLCEECWPPCRGRPW